MKNKSLRLGLCITALAFGLLIAGCASFRAVNIRTDNSLSSIRPGGTLRLSASGRDIRWSISSTSDGSGPLSQGTYINNGLLTVAANETSLFIFVFAESLRDGYRDVRQIRVTRVNSVSVSPANEVVAVGRSARFTAVVSGTNNPDNNVTWRVSTNPSGTGAAASGTSINASGVLTVSQNETAKVLYVIATSVVDTQVSGNVPVNIVIPTVTNVSVEPSNQTVRAGSTLQFRANVTGTYEPATTVTWRVSSNAAGTGVVTPGTGINNNGLLTVANNESLPVLYFIATSTVDTSKSGTVSVSVIRPIVTSVTVSPANLTVPAGSSVQFAATVAGTNNPDTTVTWRVSSNAAGTGAVTQGTSINNNGLLTISAGETSSILFVFATSTFDPNMSGSVILSVTPAPVTPPPPVNPPPTQPPVINPPDIVNPPTTPPPSLVPSGVTVIPSNMTVARGSSFPLTALVDGYTSPNPPMSWIVSSTADGTGGVSQGTHITGNGELSIGVNETAGTLYVIAIFNPDPSRFGMAVITLLN